MQAVLSAGIKQKTSTERGKKYSQHKARENDTRKSSQGQMSLLIG